MSLGTLSSSTANQVFHKRSKPYISPDVVITKPPTVSKCPLESESRRFPRIEVASRKKKLEKKSESSSDSLEFWLKPGISLPKLRSRNVPEEREEAAKVFTCFSCSSLPRGKIESESLETLSEESVKCFHAKSEPYEIPSGVVGPSQCQPLFEVPSSEINLDKLQFEEEPEEENHALQNWRKWTKRHKRQQKHLKSHLKKKNFGLLLQNTDNYRQKLESKMLLSESEIPVADKWRGHPSKWTDAPQTHKKGSSSHVLQKTRAQKGIVTDLEFIGIPDAVRTEKNIQSTRDFYFRYLKRNARLSADERIQNFLKLRKRNWPSKFSELAVVGAKISRQPEIVTPESSVVAEVPVIKVVRPDHEPSSEETRQTVFYLVINGVEIHYEVGRDSQDKNEESSDYTWELDFGVNELEKRVEKTLKIENRGTVAVEYRWISKKSEPNQSSSTFAPRHHEPFFFFNKNSGIFLPGQFYDLKFYYHARKSGVRTETWYIKTNPPLDRRTGCGTIILSAIASGDYRDLKSYVLESYITDQLKESVVRYILNVLLEKVASPDENLCELEYQSLFSQKEIFEYHNPKYYYHSEIVEELIKLFENIPSKIQKQWDLSFDSLKKLISTSAQGKERESLLRDLSTLAKRLLKPNYVFTRKEKKYRKAYNLLCKMANFMEADYNYLQKVLSNKKQEPEEKSFVESEETVNSLSLSPGEKCESSSGSSVGSLSEIKPVNLIYFQTMLYIKVYHRLSEAVENIVGMLETSKKFESSGSTRYDFSNPPRQMREVDFLPCLERFQNN